MECNSTWCGVVNEIMYVYEGGISINLRLRTGVSEFS